MASQMHALQRRWDNGATTEVDLTFEQQMRHFESQGKRLNDIGLEWETGGVKHFLPGKFVVLPDKTGVVTGCANNGSPSELIVLNADGSERFRIVNPTMPDEPRLHGRVCLELPREGWPAGTIQFGPVAVWASLPHLPVMLDLDWQTGRVLGFDQLPRFF